MAQRFLVFSRCMSLLCVLAWLPLRGLGQSLPYAATINTGAASLTGPRTATAGTVASFVTQAGASFTNNSASSIGFRVITEITVYDTNGNVVSRTESSGGNVSVAPGQTQTVGTNGTTSAPVGDTAGGKTAKARQKVTTDSNQDVTDWIPFAQIEAAFVVQPDSSGGNQNQE